MAFGFGKLSPVGSTSSSVGEHPTASKEIVMQTDLATSRTTAAARPWWHARSTLAAGLLGGCALGVIARAWMRLITETPEFTWQGTIFIVAGFTVFGLAQSAVVVARRRRTRRWKLTIVRAVGAIAMLPLFGAAGAVMLPTVLGCGLARARTDWPKIVRGLCLLPATVPVLYVGSQLADSFGWSLHTLAGFAAMLAIYATIIWATQFAFAPQADGWRMPRGVRSAMQLTIPVGALILFVAGGGFK